MCLGLPRVEASRSHSDTSHSVGLIWTSDQPDAETCTGQHATLVTDRHPCSRRDSKPSIPASERPRTHTLDRAATRICKVSSYMYKITDTHWKVKYCSDERLLTQRRTDNYNECNVSCLRVGFWDAKRRTHKSNATQPTRVPGIMSSRNTWI